jgi:hypothetical protein
MGWTSREKMIATHQAKTATRLGMTDRSREMISTRQEMIPPSRVAVAQFEKMIFTSWVATKNKIVDVHRAE